MFVKEFDGGEQPNGNVLVTVIKDWMELEHEEWRNLESVKIVGDS